MQNGTMLQYFHWYSAHDWLWKDVAENAPSLAESGITAVWLPPAYKGADGADSVGYDAYDLYDLGEFNQKGSIRTKYGTREEYLTAVKALQESGINAVVDIVLNHKAGGDETERVQAYRVDPENRTVGSEVVEIEAFTKFTFEDRAGKYSEFVWDFHCFSGVDYDQLSGDEDSIFKLLSEYGNEWDEVIDSEKGNYDFLMCCDIETRNPAVVEELERWALWYHQTVGFDGVRLDAVKHIAPGFFHHWLSRLREQTGKEIFAVGEYWAPGNLELLLRYIEATEGIMSVFDSALHHNFHHASKSGSDFDLQTILENSLVSVMPDKAVTVVENHDTQPLQALEAPVEHWFKPLAYGLILLREAGYPCIFYPDLHGCSYKDHGDNGEEYEIFLNRVDELEMLIKLRKDYAHGIQRDYFDHPNCIGWTREGDAEHGGLAVVMSNGEGGEKHMEVGTRYCGLEFKDALGKCADPVTVDEGGWATFYCPAGSISVWIES